MAINFRSNTIIKNLRVGPLSGGGNGGGSSNSNPADLDPSYLAIGAPEANSNNGAAYVYDIGNLSGTPTTLTPSPNSYGRFGQGSVITGNSLIVNARDTNYVYDITNLTASPSSFSESLSTFGTAYNPHILHVRNGNQLIIGYAYANNNYGAVYSYDLNNLNAGSTELPRNTTLYTYGDWVNQPVSMWGSSITSIGDSIIVGAGQDSEYGNSAGAIYIFDATDLSAAPTKFQPTDVQQGDRFSWSLGSLGDTLYVGAWGDDSKGSVYVYDFNNLSATPTKLFPPNNGENFGYSLAVNSKYLAVGARYAQRGAIYVYDVTDLSASPTRFEGSSQGGELGRSVTLAGDYIVGGAPYDGGTGAVYVIDGTNLSSSPTRITSPQSGILFGHSVSLG